MKRLGAVLGILTLLTGCFGPDREAAGQPVIVNQTDRELAIYAEGDTEPFDLMSSGTRENSPHIPDTDVQGCTTTTLIARDAETDQEVARREPPLCPDETWVIDSE